MWQDSFVAMYPSLAEAFLRASDDQRRQTVLTICLMGASQSGLRGEKIDAAFEILRHGKKGERALRRELKTLSEQLDEQYFQATDDTENMTPEGILLFQQSRAAEALSLALSQTYKELRAALYEAIGACDDQEAAARAAETALSAR
jgi:hypothetical protein